MNIPFFKNYFSSKDISYVKKVIERGMYWANGPEIKQFEEAVAKIADRKYAVAFNSGTSALFGMLDAVDVREKEVIVPSFTFIATCNSVIQAGGIPVFADVEEDTFSLDVYDVEKKINRNTAAIIPIHYGGFPARDIEKLRKLAKKHKIYLLEDAAESLGARIGKKPVGSFSSTAMFSFTPTKVISTGEGGMAVTNDKEIYGKMKLFRSHGRMETEDYFTSNKYMDYIQMGYGMRMPTLCAAQGLAQVEKIDLIVKKRQEIAKRYGKGLRDISQIMLPKVPKNNHVVFQMYTIVVKDGGKVRDDLQKYLEKQGISAKIYFTPIDKTSYYEKELRYKPNLPITKKLSEQVLSLPIYPDLTTAQQNFVVKHINSFFK